MDIVLPSLRTPADVLAVVPYLLGFRPADSLVVIGMRGKAVTFEARVDLPPVDAGRDEIVVTAAEIADVVARQDVTGALIIGYGVAARVTPSVDALVDALSGRAIPVADALRADDDRYWSYLCENPTCCSPDGTPYDVRTSPVAASATFAGMCPAGSRDELVARLAAPTGARLAAARRAASRADEKLYALVDSPLGIEVGREACAAAGRNAVDRAITRAAGGLSPSDDEVAWLGLLLLRIPVRDYAWERVAEDVPRHVGLWSEIVSRVDPEFVAPAATLLAYAAWRHGEGAVATIALDRALDSAPSYRMAHLLADAVAHGLSPTAVFGDVSRRP